jgi:hypothetical protein
LVASGSTSAIDISDFTRVNFFLATLGNFDSGTLVVEVAATSLYAPLYTAELVKVEQTAAAGFWFRAAGGLMRLTLSGATTPGILYSVFH